MEVGFFDQSMDFDAKLVGNPVDVAAKIPNLIDVGIEIGFHDQLVKFDMQIVEHLVLDK